jgi:predicted nucleic acid-binding protein
MEDFEDAVQYHCAVQCGARYLITRDPKGFPARGPAVVSPEEFLSLMFP